MHRVLDRGEACAVPLDVLVDRTRPAIRVAALWPAGVDDEAVLGARLGLLHDHAKGHDDVGSRLSAEVGLGRDVLPAGEVA